ncbi:MAG: diacylglycerol kinase family lipid kinase [Candidatus Izemoplasma sp.]
MKNCTIIYNPVSGKKQFVNKLPKVTKRFEEAGYKVTLKETKRQKHAIDLAKEACIEEVDLLVIAGGDGTIHECVNGIAQSDFRPKIGYIPSGTACDIAGTLKISKNVDKAVDIILMDNVAKMDIAKSNNGYFLYVTAIGTYVDISYVTDSKLKKYFGYFAYVYTGIKEFFTIPMMKGKIVYDDGDYRGYFSLILVLNSKKVAGFNVVEKPVLDDGLVDVVLYRYVPFLNNLIFFVSFFITPKALPFVHKFRTSKLKIYTDSNHKWNTDGEESNSGNVSIEVIRQAIDIIVNPKIKHKLFKEEE